MALAGAEDLNQGSYRKHGKKGMDLSLNLQNLDWRNKGEREDRKATRVDAGRSSTIERISQERPGLGKGNKCFVDTWSFRCVCLIQGMSSGR